MSWGLIIYIRDKELDKHGSCFARVPEGYVLSTLKEVAEKLGSLREEDVCEIRVYKLLSDRDVEEFCEHIDHEHPICEEIEDE